MINENNMRTIEEKKEEIIREYNLSEREMEIFDKIFLLQNQMVDELIAKFITYEKEELLEVDFNKTIGSYCNTLTKMISANEKKKISNNFKIDERIRVIEGRLDITNNAIIKSYDSFRFGVELPEFKTFRDMVEYDNKIKE